MAKTFRLARYRSMAYNSRQILEGFWNNPERRRRLHLAAIWSAWEDVVGREVADLARPLGHGKTTLLLGVEDPMAMQEMHYHAPMILEAVNASLGEVFFDKVRIDLLGGRSSLDAVATLLMEGRETTSQTDSQTLANAGISAETLGRHVGRFEDIPALERCYRTYVRRLGEGRTRHDSK